MVHPIVQRLAFATGVALTFLGSVALVQALSLGHETPLHPASLGSAPGAGWSSTPFLALAIVGTAAGLVLLLSFRPRATR